MSETQPLKTNPPQQHNIKFVNSGQSSTCFIFTIISMVMLVLTIPLTGAAIIAAGIVARIRELENSTDASSNGIGIAFAIYCGVCFIIIIFLSMIKNIIQFLPWQISITPISKRSRTNRTSRIV